jgi:hypothetical protein
LHSWLQSQPVLVNVLAYTASWNHNLNPSPTNIYARR